MTSSRQLFFFSSKSPFWIVLALVGGVSVLAATFFPVSRAWMSPDSVGLLALMLAGCAGLSVGFRRHPVGVFFACLGAATVLANLHGANHSVAQASAQVAQSAVAQASAQAAQSAVAQASAQVAQSAIAQAPAQVAQSAVAQAPAQAAQSAVAAPTRTERGHEHAHEHDAPTSAHSAPEVSRSTQEAFIDRDTPFDVIVLFPSQIDAQAIEALRKQELGRPRAVACVRGLSCVARLLRLYELGPKRMQGIAFDWMADASDAERMAVIASLQNHRLRPTLIFNRAPSSVRA